MLSTKPAERVEKVRSFCVFNIFLHIRGKEKLIQNLQTLLFPSCVEVKTLSEKQLCVENATVLL